MVGTSGTQPAQSKRAFALVSGQDHFVNANMLGDFVLKSCRQNVFFPETLCQHPDISVSNLTLKKPRSLGFLFHSKRS